MIIASGDVPWDEFLKENSAAVKFGGCKHETTGKNILLFSLILE